jgi:hypothetical protein
MTEVDSWTRGYLRDHGPATVPQLRPRPYASTESMSPSAENCNRLLEPYLAVGSVLVDSCVITIIVRYHTTIAAYVRTTATIGVDDEAHFTGVTCRMWVP